jgi:phosphoribosylformylglycinamidine synthase
MPVEVDPGYGAGASDASAIHAVHDVSSGGLAAALAEMACASGIGAHLAFGHVAELFTELPSRFVVATPDPDRLCRAADVHGVHSAVLGRADGDRLVLGRLLDLRVDDLRDAYEGNLATALGDT